MAYFDKGKITVPKPYSPLGGFNKAIQDNIKLKAAMDAQRRRDALSAAKAQMTLEAQQLRAFERQEKDLLTQQKEFDRYARDLNKNNNIDPWLQPFWQQAVQEKRAGADYFRGDRMDAEQAIDDLIALHQKMERSTIKERELYDLVKLNEPAELTKMNGQLRSSNAFMSIDADELRQKSDAALLLYNDGMFGADMRLVGGGTLGQVPQIVGREWTGQYDESGQMIYSDTESNLFESKYYHDQGNTGIFRTPTSQNFGPSYTEHADELKRGLMTDAQGGSWSYDTAKKKVDDYLYTPDSERGRAYRTRALVYDGEENGNGVYIKYSDNPDTRDRLVKMIMDWDIAEANGDSKQLYLDYKDEIDEAMSYVSETITNKTYFPDRPATQTDSGDDGPDYVTLTDEARKPYFQYDDNGGEVVGSSYSPQWLRSRELNVTKPNPEHAEWEASVNAAAQNLVDNNPAQVADRSGQPSLDVARTLVLVNPGDYGIGEEPDEETRIKIQQIIAMPDSDDTVMLMDEDGKEMTLNRRQDQSQWALLDGQLLGGSDNQITLDKIIDDMGKGFVYDEATLDRYRTREERVDVPTPNPTPQNSGAFPTFPDWQAQTGETGSDSFDKYLKAKAEYEAQNN